MSTGPSNRAASSSATPSAATSLPMSRLYVAQRIRTTRTRCKRLRPEPSAPPSSCWID